MAQTKVAHLTAHQRVKPLTIALSVFDQEATKGPEAVEYEAQVIAQARRHQSATSRGLTFQLEIANPTAKKLVIHDLFDFVRIQLKGADGRTLSMPVVESRLQRESGPLAAPRYVPNDDQLVLAYELNAVTVDGRGLSRAESEAWELSIPAHGDLKANISVPRVMVPKMPLTEGGEHLTRADTSEFGLPAGTYTVEIMLLLHSPEDKSVAVYRNYHPGYKMLVVDYGEKRAAEK